MADDTDVGEMLDDCESVIAVPKVRGGPGYNDWEREFIESVRDQHDEGRILSERQLETLDKLWNKI